jgi:hypothetical protein
MKNPGSYLKAIVGALAAAFGVAATAAFDGSFELYEYFATFGAFFSSFAAIYFTPNQP